ncbi:hypothetical protein BHE74_00033948 [Ensete ventricosum]|nr:hypothetical protein BHE74_00033948 [Ensete ventricosum]
MSRFISADDGAILCDYLPLIREYLPETAVEIESGIRESREAECNPRNDYPDEESSGDEAEGEDRDEFFDDLEHSDSDSQLEEVKFDEVDFDES